MAIDIVFASVFSTLNLWESANVFDFYNMYVKFYFLSFFNFLIALFPIDNRVKNKSTIGLPEARPGYFPETT